MEDWAEIRRLHRAEGLPIKMIARTLGISRNTVRSALASDGPPKYERKPSGSAVDAFEDAIRAELKKTPTMPATVIAERVGWTRGITVFSERVRELRPADLPPDPSGRTSYDAGDVAQCDLWFPPTTIPVGYGQRRTPTQLPVLTMVLGYSRWISAMLLPSRRAEDLFAGWWQLIATLGAVPRTLVWDGEGAIGRNRGGRIELTRDCHAFGGVLGTKVVVLKPAEPEHKGIIERAHDYFERSFLPGREFSSPGDSTTSSPSGCRSSTPASDGCWVVRRPTGSGPIWQRCWRCRRWDRRSDGATRPGWRVITTCGWTPTTTRCIRG